MKKIIHTALAPKAVGPYSQAIEANGTLYISGQLPLNPADGTMPDTIEQQTAQCLENIGAILAEAGYSFADVVKSNVLLDDIRNFDAMNGIYAKYYAGSLPARAAYQVAALPKGAMVEIETIAVK